MQTNDATESWRDLILPPERFEAIEVKLDDDCVRQAIWTGAKWWSDGVELQPKAWRPVHASADKAGERASA